MGKLNRKKLAGSTLIEVLIAMVIIMVVFSIAMGLFSNVLSGGVSIRKVQINQQLESLRLQVIESRRIEQEHLVIDSINYELIKTEQASSETDLLEIKANDHGAPAGNIRFLLKKNNENKED
jgi:type II secretory pathway pseudopilin PulG